MTILQEDEDFLEHFGKKGMKWGVRNPENRALNKASRQKDKADYRAEIDTARDRVKSGAVKQELKDAKAQFQVDKKNLGSREARKILNDKRDSLYEEISTSNQVRDGKEAAASAVMAAGVALLVASLRAA